jgi:hypothetical protein
MFNYFHKTDEALRQGANNTYAYARGNFPRLGIPDPATELKEPVESFDAALTKAKNKDHRRSDVLLKDQTKATLVDKLGAWGEEYIFHNHNLTAEDIIAFDLHQNKPRSPKKPPDVVPVFVVITAFVRQLRFKYFKMPGAKRMGKPEGASKFVVYYLVSKEKPTVDQLVNKATASEGELVIDFKDEERGLPVWFITCWAIEHNDMEGPKSEMQMALVP